MADRVVQPGRSALMRFVSQTPVRYEVGRLTKDAAAANLLSHQQVHLGGHGAQPPTNTSDKSAPHEN
jgi:hypothetical protein